MISIKIKIDKIVKTNDEINTKIKIYLNTLFSKIYYIILINWGF
jgi:hypothetical protein